MKAAAETWRDWAMRTPGGHPKASQPAEQLVAAFLETQQQVLNDDIRWAEWSPGVAWDLSELAALPRDLRDRCQRAPDASPFMSYCD